MSFRSWSGGQLFACSGLDDEVLISKDIPGILCADLMGVRLYAKRPHLLWMGRPLHTHPVVDGLGGDFFTLSDQGEQMAMVYLQSALIGGKTIRGGDICLAVEGAKPALFEGVAVYDLREGNYPTLNGNFSAFIQEGERFALAFGDTAREAIALAKRGLTADLEEEIQTRKARMAAIARPASDPYADLYEKCASTMRTQIYSPEGKIRHRWSTPDRLPHRKMWFWDSVFHAVGWRNLDPALAEELLLAMVDVQTADGRFPLDATPTACAPESTQPPLLAWGALKVYEKTGNQAFLKQIYTANSRHLDWIEASRRYTELPLYSWQTEDNHLCRCGESGMDNSPRFDTEHPLFAIDYTCFVASECCRMAEIAEILNLPKDKEVYLSRFAAIKDAVDQYLWCEEDGFYYDWDRKEQTHHKVRAVSSFLPLFAGLCNKEQATALLCCLQDPTDFAAEFPIPSISKRDATYGSDMWRGPVWINYNYMIAEGLEKNGFSAEAESLRRRTVEVLNQWFKVYGTVFEFYDCENQTPPPKLYRKGEALEPYDFFNRLQAIRDYGWSNTLLLDLLSRK